MPLTHIEYKRNIFKQNINEQLDRQPQHIYLDFQKYIHFEESGWCRFRLPEFATILKNAMKQRGFTSLESLTLNMGNISFGDYEDNSINRKYMVIETHQLDRFYENLQGLDIKAIKYTFPLKYTDLRAFLQHHREQQSQKNGVPTQVQHATSSGTVSPPRTRNEVHNITTLS